jgi:hypothetical protein
MFTQGTAATMLRDCGLNGDTGNAAAPADFFSSAVLQYQVTGTIGSPTFLGLFAGNGISVGSFRLSGNSMIGTFTGFTAAPSGPFPTLVYHTEPAQFTLAAQP